MKFDPEKVSKAFKNILENTIENAPKNSEIEVDVRKNGTFLIIKIEDSSSGSDKEIRNTEREVLNMGLGLFISNKIIQAHGGKMKLESKGTNKGYITTIEIPF